MVEACESSITRHYGEFVKSRNQDAVRKLWGHYYLRLVRLARAKLRGTRRTAADEEDVALSAFNSFCDIRGARPVPGARGPGRPLEDPRDDHAPARPPTWPGTSAGKTRGWARPRLATWAGPRNPHEMSSPWSRVPGRRPNSRPSSPRRAGGSSACSATTRSAGSRWIGWRATTTRRSPSGSDARGAP